jgi:methyl-accepting chemotaxis protein
MFPPDYFAKYLATPLAQLRGASEDIADHVRRASVAVADSSQGLVQASRRLRDRTGTIEGSFDTVVRLVQQQGEALQGAQRHMAVLSQVAGALAGIDVVLDRAAAGVEASGAATAALVRRVTSDRLGDAATRELIEQSVSEIAAKLDAVVAQLKVLHREVATTPTIAAAPPSHRASGA